RLEGAQGLVSRREGLALATKLLGDIAQLFQAFMVAGEVQCPGAAEQQQAAEGSGIEGTLAPVDAAYLALVETRQFGFGEDHPAEQLVDEARAAAAEGR